MTRKSFIFDTNKCTGCNACQIACILENELDYSASWRKVVTFNPDHNPELVTFHLSMACNHCADPSCQKYCPANAIFRSDQFDTVHIDPNKCIGCKYCSWTCPYDAPDFNQSKGIMEKCTFCLNRLKEGLEPSCATLCPTGALNTGSMDSPAETVSVPGFTPTKIDPALQIIPRRRSIELPKQINSYNSDILDAFHRHQQRRNNKINPRSEWSLIVFSLLVPIIVAGQTVSAFTGRGINPVYLIILTIFTMLISLSHLGKRTRAYRAILNWQNSWISREIILMNLFLICMVLQIYFPLFDWIGASVGIGLLISMDMVYHILPRSDQNQWHSSRIFLTAILLGGLFAHNYLLFSGVLIIKFTIYLKHQIISGRWFDIRSLVRIVCGFILPPLLWFTEYPATDVLVFIFLMTGESLDRIDFYRDIEIISPQVQMAHDLHQKLSRIKTD